MKIKYDKEANAVYIAFNTNKIVDTEEGEPGVIVDYDSVGAIVGIEILNASELITDLGNVEYEII